MILLCNTASQRNYIRLIVAATLVVVCSNPIKLLGQDTGLEGAVALWRFDDGSGTWAINEVDFMFDGTLVGDPTWIEGVYGSALQYDGDDDAMEVSANPMTGAHAFTIQAYIQPTAIPDRSGEPSAKIFTIALERATEGYDRFMFEIVPRESGWGVSHFMAIDGSRSEPDVNTLPSHAFDAWYHMALVFDSLAADTVQIKQYVNHTLELEVAYPFGNLTDGALYIGRRYIANSAGSFCYYQGVMDNLVLHTRALAPEEFMPLPEEVIGIETGRGTVPGSFTLEQNYPNPFNPGTSIRYAISASAFPVNLEIFDLAGRKVSTLASEVQNAGIHRVQWDGKDGAGAIIPAGIYIYRLSVGQERLSRKMLLLR
jgi:hypothetical protein